MGSEETVHQLRVAINEIDPPIWRRLQVPSRTTLAELHSVIQAAFGWWDYHLHDFNIRDVRYGTDDGEGWDAPVDERRARLDPLASPGESFTYTYDFGDFWQHSVEVEEVLAADPDQSYPRLVDGARARPPEDCGGPGGYAGVLEAVADPAHEEHESMLEWLGGPYDPEYFDPADFYHDLRFGPVFGMTAPVGGLDEVAEAAVARLGTEDRSAAKLAAVSLCHVAEGGRVQSITQQTIQRFLWEELPQARGAGLDARLVIAESLARVLDLLEMPRYADICRSGSTDGVLRAHEQGRVNVRGALLHADTSSGVRPPDLPDLVWGVFKGEWESEVYAGLSQMLELAVAAGDLKPGSRGWKVRQREMVLEHLDTPHTELAGRTPRQMVLAERIEHWTGSRRNPVRGQMLAPIADLLQEPQPPPAETELFPNLCWLLEQLADGVPLTQTGNLSRAFVQGAAPRFGWDWPGLPRHEDDLFDLHLTREFAKRARLARRQGRKLLLTSRGRGVLADRTELWRVAAAHLLPTQDFDAAVGEVALVRLLSHPELPRDELVAQIKPAVQAGFRDPATGQQPSDRDVNWVLGDTLRLCRVLGLLVEAGGWTDRRYGLTETGRALATEVLRLLATGPRMSHF